RPETARAQASSHHGLNISLPIGPNGDFHNPAMSVPEKTKPRGRLSAGLQIPPAEPAQGAISAQYGVRFATSQKPTFSFSWNSQWPSPRMSPGFLSATWV